MWYCLESNMGSATLAGMPSTKGIRGILGEVIRSFQFGHACVLLIMTILMMGAIDILSQRLRKLFIREDRRAPTGALFRA